MGDELQQVVAPVVESLGLELVDLEQKTGFVRVVVDRAGGVDLDRISEATRRVSDALDRHDPLPGGRYTLEISSPGLERTLETPAQFARAVGEQVMVRTLPSAGLERRLRGTLVAADSEAIVLSGDEVPQDSTRVSYSDIDRARTVFEWGGAPRPRPGHKPGSKSAKRANPPGPSAPAGQREARPEGVRQRSVAS